MAAGLFKKNKQDDKTVKATADVKIEKQENEKTQKQEKVVKKDGKKKIDINAYKVISNPTITEKATDLAAFNKYVFDVSTTANKSEIKKTIINLYGVTPTKVNIVRKSGKRVRYGRTMGKRKDTKKAIVTLQEGQTIDVHEGV